MQAQDLIVTVAGDSIPCKVANTNETFVYYFPNAKRMKDPLVIARVEVAQLRLNAYPGRASAAPSKVRSERDHIYISATYGFGRLLVNNEEEDSEFEDYNDELRSGTALRIDVGYFISEDLAIVLNYGFNRFENEADVIYNPTSTTGKLRDDIALNYYGLGIFYQIKPGRGPSFLGISAGFGVTDYGNDAVLIAPYKLDAYGLGINLAVAYHLSLSDGFFIPLSVGIKGFDVGNIKAQYSDEMPVELRRELETSINATPNFQMSRLELSIGIALTF